MIVTLEMLNEARSKLPDPYGEGECLRIPTKVPFRLDNFLYPVEFEYMRFDNRKFVRDGEAFDAWCYNGIIIKESGHKRKIFNENRNQTNSLPDLR